MLSQNRRSFSFAQNHIDIHCCSSTNSYFPTTMTSPSYLFVCLVALLLSSPALSWNLPFRRNKAATKPLFYQTTDLDTEGLFTSSSTVAILPEATAAIPLSSTVAQPQQQPRAMDLPKHSPPRELLQRQKAMLDAELLVGRAAMVAALVLFVNEFFTGDSMLEQVTSLFR